jgi:hypothetical protein
MQTFEQAARVRIEFDGFDEWPALRRDLLAFINVFCADMTLSQAREWFDEAFPGVSSLQP